MILNYGADPEFPAYINDCPISLCGILGGSKEIPELIPGTVDCFKSEDNVMAEICIPPSNDLETLFKYIESAKECTELFLSEKLSNNVTLKNKSSERYPLDELCHEKAFEFGCEPAYSIYEYEIKPPSLQKIKNIRSAGFHLHFEIKNCNLIKFIYLCDLFLGIPSFIYDEDTDRRKLYGNLGEYRLKSYGVEYRTMGSGMLDHKSIIIEGVDKIKYYYKNETKIRFDQNFKILTKLHKKWQQNIAIELIAKY